MSILRSLRNLANLKTFFVVVIFVAIVGYYYSNMDWTLECMASYYKRFDFIAEIDQAQPDHGFDGKKFYLKIHDEKYGHEDNSEIYIFVRPMSQFHYDDISIYPNAKLTVGFGFFEIFPDQPLKPVTFEVEFVADGQSTVIISKTLTPLGEGRIKQFFSCERDLRDLEGETGRFIFRCKCEQKCNYYCAWVNPLISSDGERDRLKHIFFDQEQVAYDFIESSAKYLPIADGEIEHADWATIIRDSKEEIRKIVSPCCIDYGFIPQSDITCNNSGKRAAIAFVKDKRLIIPRVEIPDTAQSLLRDLEGLAHN